MALQQGVITMTGRVGGAPQAYGTNNPPTVCSFRLGCSRGYYDANRQWVSLPTTWITVKAYRALASNVLVSLRVGGPVIVTGVLGTEEWQTETNEKRARTFLVASNIGHDLNYGTTYLNRPRREATDAPRDQRNGSPQGASIGPQGGMPLGVQIDPQPEPNQGGLNQHGMGQTGGDSGAGQGGAGQAGVNQAAAAAGVSDGGSGEGSYGGPDAVGESTVGESVTSSGASTDSAAAVDGGSAPSAGVAASGEFAGPEF